MNWEIQLNGIPHLILKGSDASFFLINWFKQNTSQQISKKSPSEKHQKFCLDIKRSYCLQFYKSEPFLWAWSSRKTLRSPYNLIFFGSLGLIQIFAIFQNALLSFMTGSVCVVLLFSRTLSYIPKRTPIFPSNQIAS